MNRQFVIIEVPPTFDGLENTCPNSKDFEFFYKVLEHMGQNLANLTVPKAQSLQLKEVLRCWLTVYGIKLLENRDRCQHILNTLVAMELDKPAQIKRCKKTIAAVKRVCINLLI